MLRDIVRRVGPCTLAPSNDHFLTLAEAIIWQQLSWKAARSIHARLLEALGSERPRPADVARAPDAALAGAGVSRQKIRYLQAGSPRSSRRNGSRAGRSAGSRTTRSPGLLTRIKGVGPWTVDMYLIFGLNRLDVFPAGDLGLVKSIGLAVRIRGRARREARSSPSRKSGVRTGRSGHGTCGRARTRCRSSRRVRGAAGVERGMLRAQTASGSPVLRRNKGPSTRSRSAPDRTRDACHARQLSAENQGRGDAAPGPLRGQPPPRRVQAGRRSRPGGQHRGRDAVRSRQGVPQGPSTTNRGTFSSGWFTGSTAPCPASSSTRERRRPRRVSRVSLPTRKVEKIYFAVVSGEPAEEQGDLVSYIERVHKRSRVSGPESERAKEALSSYRRACAKLGFESSRNRSEDGKTSPDQAPARGDRAPHRGRHQVRVARGSPRQDHRAPRGRSSTFGTRRGTSAFVSPPRRRRSTPGRFFSLPSIAVLNEMEQRSVANSPLVGDDARVSAAPASAGSLWRGPRKRSPPGRVRVRGSDVFREEEARGTGRERATPRRAG